MVHINLVNPKINDYCNFDGILAPGDDNESKQLGMHRLGICMSTDSRRSAAVVSNGMRTM